MRGNLPDYLKRSKLCKSFLNLSFHSVVSIHQLHPHISISRELTWTIIADRELRYSTEYSSFTAKIEKLTLAQIHL